MRFTRIIATIGPATATPEKLLELAKLGVNICRLNFSHGDHEYHGKTIKTIRDINKKGYSMAIMLDTKGPEVRTGDTKTPVEIHKGDLVAFTPKPITGKEKVKTIQVNYDLFARDAKHARCIVIDNGAIEMKVTKIEKNVVTARALEGGIISSRRHVNLPGAYISLPSFTDKDWKDIRFGIEQGVDFYATSFVRTGEDIEELRKFLLKHKSKAHIIAKIETPQAVENIDDIIATSDGIMVARGDLGSEVPFEDVPKIQDEIVRKCRLAGKPVIVATHMLESMILHPTPTRAEVTDIAHAAQTQADSTMLSGETAGGMYPIKSVIAMGKVLQKSERLEPTFDLLADERSSSEVGGLDILRREQALAASVLATTLSADALVVISKSGRTARAVSNCRPLVPIYAFTDDEACQRRMMLLWGVIPEIVKLSEKSETTAHAAMEILKKKKLITKGQRVVVVTDIGLSGERIMSIQIRLL